MDKILARTILDHPLLVRLNLEFIKGEEEKIHVTAEIDWINKKFASKGVPAEEELVRLDDDDDFETALSRKLKIFRRKVIELIELHKVDAADYSISLRNDLPFGSLSDVVNREFNVQPVSEQHRRRRSVFEEKFARTGGIKASYASTKVNGLGISARSLPLEDIE